MNEKHEWEELMKKNEWETWMKKMNEKKWMKKMNEMNENEWKGTMGSLKTISQLWW